MGFTRYKNRNLFKNPPTEPIDAITLKPGNVKNKARYIMITGNKYLSPSNNEEIDAATNKNTNGERIKVIIISRTGTEGIDFNNIRQVHLLEPWYNNNRSNQVIGRAVRNCSHKQLPLEERNVEIYKYGTMLENTDEEAGDMFLYRLADNKSKKIGNITRIMKETAIDCMLNKDVIKTNRKIKQVLSSGEEISYELRDKPYSELCDYKENCDYKCDPYKTSLDVNEETYNEEFILMNIQIVITKIKNLFKQHYVLKKGDIIKRINQNNNYPKQQIDSALSMLVGDESNFVFDKLNRRGNIVNVGEYYLFQPVEITNKNISVYHRSTPLDIKPELLSIKLPEVVVSKTKNKDIDNILEEIVSNFEKSQIKDELKKSDEELNWYRIAGNAYYRIKKWLPDFNRENFNECVIEHILDVLELNNKVELYNYCLQNEPSSRPIKMIKSIMNKRLMDKKFIVLVNNNNSLEYYKVENNTLVKAKPTDKTKIINYITDNKNSIFSNPDLIKELNKVIGIMSYFKNKNVVFKRKNIKNEKHKGSRCDQNSREIEGFFNEELDIKLELYKKQNKNVTKREKIVKKAIQLCTDQEIIMRYYDKIEFKNKLWFFSIEETIIADEVRIYTS